MENNVGKKKLTQVESLFQALGAAKERGIKHVGVQTMDAKFYDLDYTSVSGVTGVTIFVKK